MKSNNAATKVPNRYYVVKASRPRVLPKGKAYVGKLPRGI